MFCYFKYITFHDQAIIIEGNKIPPQFGDISSINNVFGKHKKDDDRQHQCGLQLILNRINPFHSMKITFLIKKPIQFPELDLYRQSGKYSRPFVDRKSTRLNSSHVK